jgi:hypothetical protein
MEAINTFRIFCISYSVYHTPRLPSSSPGEKHQANNPFHSILSCNLHLIDEIRSSGSIVRFMDIRSDTCSASHQLTDDRRRFPAAFHCTAYLDDISRERL